MDELLAALQAGLEENVSELALDLFFTEEWKLNLAQVNEFEHYAPCKVTFLERPCYIWKKRQWKSGEIFYRGKTFAFG